MTRDTQNLRCPVAYVENDHVYRCDLNYGHAQWHLSQEFGYLTIWPHDLRDWAERNKGSEPTGSTGEIVLIEETPPQTPVAPVPRSSLLRFRPSFTLEDWTGNWPLGPEECLHANPRLYGLPDEEMLWWEFMRGWEPEDGVLSEKDIADARFSARRWQAHAPYFVIREHEFS